jgi:LmbE family N-acetylglucosaminyl deacetylase
MNAAVAADSPFTGDILVCAPHMDDDALGCGMLIAMHASKGRVHALFVSDGALSPEPAPGRPDDSRGLPAIRELEARAGLEILGVPQANITFLGLPDGALAHHEESIAAAVTDQARAVGARAVLVPFRYDRHPDHLALNRAATAAHAAGGIAA